MEVIMKVVHKKMSNRSSKDRRKSTEVTWSGIERRRASEKRIGWERISMWKSTHKAPKPGVLYDSHQLMP